jgi:hypothetical protein
MIELGSFQIEWRGFAWRFDGEWPKIIGETARDICWIVRDELNARRHDAVGFVIEVLTITDAGPGRLYGARLNVIWDPRASLAKRPGGIVFNLHAERVLIECGIARIGERLSRTRPSLIEGPVLLADPN